MVNQRSRENDYAITHALISLCIFLTCSTSRRSVPFVVQKVLYSSFFQKSILHGLFSFLLADFKSRVIIFNWMILLQTFVVEDDSIQSLFFTIPLRKTIVVQGLIKIMLPINVATATALFLSGFKHNLNSFIFLLHSSPCYKSNFSPKK